MKHITSEERHTIEHLLGQNQSVISIAKQLSRAPSTIYRELERNADQRNQKYSYNLANRKAQERQLRWTPVFGQRVAKLSYDI